MGETVRVVDKETNEQIRPRALYFDAMFSHLKKALATETEYDISNRTVFSDLHKAVGAIKQQIMIDGRGNISHVISEGLKKETLKKRKLYIDKFKTFVSEN